MMGKQAETYCFHQCSVDRCTKLADGLHIRKAAEGYYGFEVVPVCEQHRIFLDAVDGAAHQSVELIIRTHWESEERSFCLWGSSKP